MSAKNSVKAQVVRFLRQRPKSGATSDEIERRLGLPHQTVSARLTELTSDRTIRRTKEKRKTRSGGVAGVYKAYAR